MNSITKMLIDLKYHYLVLRYWNFILFSSDIVKCCTIHLYCPRKYYTLDNGVLEKIWKKSGRHVFTVKSFSLFQDCAVADLVFSLYVDCPAVSAHSTKHDG